ncbi:MAG: GatB/YqeY domain-containing protein [Patescibacteria group bacterium]
MPTISQNIEGDLKEAMKAKNESALSTLRMVRAAFKNKQIDVGHDLTDDEATAVMRTMVKQYKDALNDFRNAGRTDLADKQAKEIELIEHYLPAMMSEAQVEELAKAVISEMNATLSDTGKVMGAVMKKAAGQADGTVVRNVVEKLLKG